MHVWSVTKYADEFESLFYTFHIMIIFQILKKQILKNCCHYIKKLSKTFGLLVKNNQYITSCFILHLASEDDREYNLLLFKPE